MELGVVMGKNEKEAGAITDNANNKVPPLSEQNSSWWKRCRLRDLGVSIGRYQTGKFNAITDVKGVKVGHTTLIQGQGKMTSKKSGPVRTGVTAIIPSDNIFHECLTGGAFILNGAGELSGLTQVVEWGTIESPILLTNTLSVGICADALINHMTETLPGIGVEHDVIIPLVGECDDSWLNNITGNHLKAEHVVNAIKSAKSGPVEEGNVGGGTGMITCDFKGGIGTSSRKLPSQMGGYTVGVLVMSNFGERHSLRIDGIPVGKILQEKFKNVGARVDNYGSIIVVIATDCPLSSHQLNRLCKRAALGIGRAGSYAAHGSGEILLAFSTSNKIPRDTQKHPHKIRVIPDKRMNPLYEAVVDTTEEAIINALCAGESMYGLNNRFSPGLPLDDVKAIIEEYQKFSKSIGEHQQIKKIYNRPPINLHQNSLSGSNQSDNNNSSKNLNFTVAGKNESSKNEVVGEVKKDLQNIGQNQKDGNKTK